MESEAVDVLKALDANLREQKTKFIEFARKAQQYGLINAETFEIFASSPPHKMTGAATILLESMFRLHTQTMGTIDEIGRTHKGD